MSANLSVQLSIRPPRLMKMNLKVIKFRVRRAAKTWPLVTDGTVLTIHAPLCSHCTGAHRAHLRARGSLHAGLAHEIPTKLM